MGVDLDQELKILYNFKTKRGVGKKWSGMGPDLNQELKI